MNIAGLFGLLAAITITTFSILDATSNPKIFADVHGIVIVIGGTLTVALIAFDFRKLWTALKIVTRKTLGREKDDYMGTIKLIVSLAETYRTNPKGLAQALPANAHPFLKDAVEMITSYGFSAEELDEVLSNAMKGKQKRDDEEVKVWHTVSRFPPAFGLMGAVLGMISLLQTLGEPGAQDKIGPAMATALIATFYGILLANMVLIPIAEKLGTVSQSDRTMRAIIRDGVIMIVDKRHPTYIEEFLKSFLKPSARESISSDGGGSSGGARAA